MCAHAGMLAGAQSSRWSAARAGVLCARAPTDSGEYYLHSLIDYIRLVMRWSNVNVSNNFKPACIWPGTGGGRAVGRTGSDVRITFLLYSLYLLSTLFLSRLCSLFFYHIPVQ